MYSFFEEKTFNTYSHFVGFIFHAGLDISKHYSIGINKGPDMACFSPREMLFCSPEKKVVKADRDTIFF